jgi:hypothetical protein
LVSALCRGRRYGQSWVCCLSGEHAGPAGVPKQLALCAFARSKRAATWDSAAERPDTVYMRQRLLCVAALQHPDLRARSASLQLRVHDPSSRLRGVLPKEMKLATIPGPPGRPLVGNMGDIDAEQPMQSLCSLTDTYGQCFPSSTCLDILHRFPMPRHSHTSTLPMYSRLRGSITGSG